MSSETITRNDLTGILNEVLPIPQGAYYDLVWQNPNGIGSMTALMSGETALTLTKSTSSFDGFLCEFRCYYNTGQKTYGHYFTGAYGMYAQTTVTREVGNPMMEFSRAWWVSGDTTISVSDCTRIVSNGSNVVGQDTGCLVPLRIWGIKLKTVGVSPFQTDYIVEQGTDGIWTYRKWNSGVAECWGYKLTSGTFSAWGSGYSHDIPPENFPTGLFTAMPYCFVTSSCTDANSVSSANADYTTKDHAPGITVWRGTSVSGSHNFASWYYAKGTWK